MSVTHSLSINNSANGSVIVSKDNIDYTVFYEQDPRYIIDFDYGDLIQFIDPSSPYYQKTMCFLGFVSGIHEITDAATASYHNGSNFSYNIAESYILCVGIIDDKPIVFELANYFDPNSYEEVLHNTVNKNFKTISKAFEKLAKFKKNAVIRFTPDFRGYSLSIDRTCTIQKVYATASHKGFHYDVVVMDKIKSDNNPFVSAKNRVIEYVPERFITAL